MYRFKLYHEVAGEYELQHAPVGWETLEMTLTRDAVLHGVTLDFTSELEFVKDGFDFVHAVYEAFGIEANVLLYVYEASRLGYHYSLVYVGTLALEKWEVSDFPRAGKTNVDVASFAQRLLNGEDTEINLQATTGLRGNAMGPLPTMAIEAHSQGIVQGFDGQQKSNQEAAPVWMNEPTEGTWGAAATKRFYFGFDEIVTNTLGVVAHGLSWTDGDQDNPLLQSQVNATLTFDLHLQGAVRGSNDKQGDLAKGDFDDMYVDIVYRKNQDAEVKLFSYHKGGIQETHQAEYAVSRTFSVDVVPGDEVFVYGILRFASISSPAIGRWAFQGEHFFFEGSHLKISGLTSTASSGAAGVLLHEAFARVSESILGYPNVFYSDFLGRTDSQPRNYPVDGEGSRLLLLNGFALRGFPQEYDPTTEDAEKLKRYLHTSLKDLFKNTDNIFCLGLGIERVQGEQVVRVERRQHFYQRGTVATHLGHVRNLKKQARDRDYYKEARFGYREWKIEETNGLNEWNGQQTWNTPVTRTKHVYDKVCDFIASGYRIEKTRRSQYTADETKDGPDDERLFLLELTRGGSGWKTRTNEELTEIGGVPNPANAYNLRLSPAAMLRNHLGVLDASLYKMSAGLLFSKGEANYKMRYRDAKGLVQNGQHLGREQVTGAWFYPEEYTLEADVSQFQAAAIRDNPYAEIHFFDASGALLRGYLLEMKYKQREQTATFKLLRVSE